MSIALCGLPNGLDCSALKNDNMYGYYGRFVLNSYCKELVIQLKLEIGIEICCLELQFRSRNNCNLRLFLRQQSSDADRPQKSGRRLSKVRFMGMSLQSAMLTASFFGFNVRPGVGCRRRQEVLTEPQEVHHHLAVSCLLSCKVQQSSPSFCLPAC
jgi:hypothetical protein